MLQSTGNFFTKNIALKVLSLILAILIWFYIANELSRGSQEELQALRKMMRNKYISEQSGNGKIRR